MSWLLAFAGFAALIILHELGHFAVAKLVGMRVERFSLFFPPLLARRKRGETEYAIGAIPLGGYVKITGMNPHEEIPPEIRPRAYYLQPVWKRVVVILAGPVVNIVIAFAIFWGYFLANGVEVPKAHQVGGVERNYPAAGKLLPGDRILSVDGVNGSAAELSRQIRKHTCPGTRPSAGCAAREPATVVIRRGEQRLTLRLAPVYDARTKRMRLGFSFDRVFRDVGPGAAVGESLDLMWRVTSGTVSTLAQLFKAEKREEVSGVIGSYETTRAAVQVDFSTAMLILGLISLSLGVINLFPFLPLDGGHIFWAVGEKIRGRPIAFSVMERAGFVGFALVIFLFMIGLTNDIDRLRGDGFGFQR